MLHLKGPQDYEQVSEKRGQSIFVYTVEAMQSILYKLLKLELSRELSIKRKMESHLTKFTYWNLLLKYVTDEECPQIIQ